MYELWFNVYSRTPGSRVKRLAPAEHAPFDTRTEVRQSEFRQELGLRNLVTSQILNIVGLYWVGTAARLGSSHVAFWILGIALFYLPSTAVVIYLNRVHPLEGGIYEWARLGFNRFFGFLVAWNMWLNLVSILSYVGIQTTTMAAYAMGPQAPWMAESKVLTGAVTVAILIALIVIASIGLSLGKLQASHREEDAAKRLEDLTLNSRAQTLTISDQEFEGGGRSSKRWKRPGRRDHHHPCEDFGTRFPYEVGWCRGVFESGGPVLHRNRFRSTCGSESWRCRLAR